MCSMADDGEKASPLSSPTAPSVKIAFIIARKEIM